MEINATINFTYELTDGEIEKFRLKVLEHIEEELEEENSITLDDVSIDEVEKLLLEALPVMLEAHMLGYGGNGVDIDNYFNTIALDYCSENVCDLIEEMAEHICSKRINFDEFVQKLENGAKTFEEVYTGMGLEVVECIGNVVYDDQDLYDFLEALGAHIADYGVGFAVIETDAGRTYEVPYENRPNRFDPEYTEETVIFFDGKSIYDITESEER